MKVNEESQRKKLRKAKHKAVLVDFQKINRLFCDSTNCFYQQLIKTT